MTFSLCPVSINPHAHAHTIEIDVGGSVNHILKKNSSYLTVAGRVEKDNTNKVQI